MIARRLHLLDLCLQPDWLARGTAGDLRHSPSDAPASPEGFRTDPKPSPRASRVCMTQAATSAADRPGAGAGQAGATSGLARGEPFDRLPPDSGLKA